MIIDVHLGIFEEKCIFLIYNCFIYLQAELPIVYSIDEIGTKGWKSSNEWVTTYKLSFSTTGGTDEDLVVYQESGNDKVQNYHNYSKIKWYIKSS